MSTENQTPVTPATTKIEPAQAAPQQNQSDNKQGADKPPAQQK